MNVRLKLSDPSIKDLAKASCPRNACYENLPKLLGEANWQEWSDALQHAALMAGTDAVLNGESKHPPSLDEQQSTTAQWNDNVKRTAVWRRRNGSLLKAMRNASAVDTTAFDGANAHQIYLNLESQYHTSDSQRVQALYEEELMLNTTELADSPQDIANSLQSAFDQYNQLVGRNIKQRLPENFLKMEFLMSLDSAYGDWRKALLKEQNVLALDQGSTLTFNELVDLVISERTRLLQEQTNIPTPAPTASQRPLKRNISRVDEPAQPDLRKPCSSSHHDTVKHTNPHSNDTSSEDSENDEESDSEVENDIEEQIFAGDQEHLSVDKDAGDNNRATIEEEWQNLVAAHHAEVRAQRNIVTAGFKDSGNNRRRYPTLRGDLNGEWLLYNKNFNPGTGGHHHLHLWDNSSEKKKRLHPKNYEYGGKLFTGPRGKTETFEIALFSPSHNVTGRRQPIRLTQAGRKARKGWMIFWGNGKMVVTVPAPVIGDASGRLISMEFAGIQKKAGSSDDEGNNDQNVDDESSSSDSSDSEERYDRVIRTERRASVAIKVEEDDNTARVRGAEEAIACVAIKAEESDSSDFDDE